MDWFGGSDRLKFDIAELKQRLLSTTASILVHKGADRISG